MNLHYLKKAKKQRKIYKLNYINYLYLKYLTNNRYLQKDLLNIFQMKLNQKNIKNRISFVENRCIYSGKSRSVLKVFRLSRNYIQNLGALGLIIGLKRSSW